MSTKTIAVLSLVAAMAVAAGPASADNTAIAGSGSKSVSDAQAINAPTTLMGQSATQGVTQGITFNSPTVPTSTDVTVRSAPQIMAPALTTTLTETCMGSSSVGASGIGFGVTFGSTWTDKDCQNRLDARQLVSMGYRDAARVVMCANPVVREAFKATGNPCPGDQAAKVSQSDSTSNKPVASAETQTQDDQVALVTTDSQGRTWKRADKESSWVLVQK